MRGCRQGKGRCAGSDFAEGERIHLKVVLADARATLRSVDLAVSVDFERGYAAASAGVTDAISALAACRRVAVDGKVGAGIGAARGAFVPPYRIGI